MIDEIKEKLNEEEFFLNKIISFDSEDHNAICGICNFKTKTQQGMRIHLSRKHDVRFIPERESAVRTRLSQHRETQLDTIQKIIRILNQYPRSDNFNIDGKLRSADSIIINEITEDFTLNTKEVKA